MCWAPALFTLVRRQQALGIVIATHYLGLTARPCTLNICIQYMTFPKMRQQTLCAVNLVRNPIRSRLPWCFWVFYIEESGLAIVAKDSRGNLAQGKRFKRAKQQRQSYGDRVQQRRRFKIRGSSRSSTRLDTSQVSGNMIRAILFILLGLAVRFNLRVKHVSQTSDAQVYAAIISPWQRGSKSKHSP